MTHLPNGIPENLGGERGGSTSSQLSGLTVLSASQSPTCTSTSTRRGQTGGAGQE